MKKCGWWYCEEETEKEFCSAACGNKWRVDMRRREVKLRLVEMLGGKCKQCGYAECVEALEFHHRDPSTKRFQLSSGDTPSWHLLVDEAQKCDLLCANCHRAVEGAAYRERWEVARKRLAELNKAQKEARVQVTAAERNKVSRHRRRMARGKPNLTTRRVRNQYKEWNSVEP